jgi:hypothetical protein
MSLFFFVFIVVIIVSVIPDCFTLCSTGHSFEQLRDLAPLVFCKADHYQDLG